MSTADVSSALQALETLAASNTTSSYGPLSNVHDKHIAIARQRLAAGNPPKQVIIELQQNITKSKKEVEKGLKQWYSALGTLGKSVEKSFPQNIQAMSSAYDDPPLFSDPTASAALDRVILDSLGRRGLWDAVGAFEPETGMTYDADKRGTAEELYRIVSDIESGDLASAIEWCTANKAWLASGPHPSDLPYHLHRSVFLEKKKTNPRAALDYAKENLVAYLNGPNPVLALVTSCIFPDDKNSPYTNEAVPLAAMFRADYCRFHGWAREEPLEVAVDLGSRGGALNAIEKARKVMGDRLGSVRTWQELPMEVPLAPTRRYHSVFVCPVSKEQTTDSNPPKMLSCGHVIAQESFQRLLKSGRRSAKCPYCPVETTQPAAQRLYF